MDSAIEKLILSLYNRTINYENILFSVKKDFIFLKLSVSHLLFSKVNHNLLIRFPIIVFILYSACCK